MSTVTKRHHYVPVTYLKAFCRKNGIFGPGRPLIGLSAKRNCRAAEKAEACALPNLVRHCFKSRDRTTSVSRHPIAYASAP